MNKSELVDHISEAAHLSKAEANRALEAAIAAIESTLQRGGVVSIVGFGTFTAEQRAERNGRNPRTGDSIKIEAARVPKFRPGKAFREAVA